MDFCYFSFVFALYMIGLHVQAAVFCRYVHVNFAQII